MIDWLRREALEPEIEIAGRVLPIELNRNRRAKRLTLRLAPDGSAVRITLPHWCRSVEALAFAHARADWLGEQLAKVPERRDPLGEGKLTYCGHEVRIGWSADHPRKPVLDTTGVRVGGPQETLTRRLQRWLEAEAQRLFAQDAQDYCSRADLTVADVRLTRAKRRWGSCSREGVLRLNWRLVQAPGFVRRSVVAHEVAHLVHFDHSPAFHALLDELFEGNIEDANAWLGQHGRTLYAAFG
ncbi:SprT family zinc-dependent metalloprotease [Qipengyuania sp. XHP0211]|uniref:M48 family metallopeptidase n=1 Tax=Qipengyuania sp. XHP0211 TaxID=3038079 RepID=UPI00241F8BF5|nr:SprT family zinc-dependent metalloprotease [Qipengyuania sp. XHP0211]MDG5750501.1 SprT family zinc-dependent metalloprotease [Qipengyuania sp. XHP0211]